MNECSIQNGDCEHLCTDFTGGHVCSCFNGSILTNGHNCNGELSSVNECVEPIYLLRLPMYRHQ